VAYDETNPANVGIKPDAADPTHDSVRGGAIWAHVLAGGAGCEFYFGYDGSAFTDLSCQDWRSRDIWWDQSRYALEFFMSNAIPFQNMTNRDSLLTGASGSHCFAANGQVYVGHLVTNATPSLNLTGVTGDFTVRWFNPFSGGGLQTGSVAQVTGGGTRSLGGPPANSTKDWVVLVKRIPPAQPHLILLPGDGGWRLVWTEPDFVLERAFNVTGPWTNVLPPATSPYPLTPAGSREFFRLQWTSP
jgi:hypothetical protein